MGHENLHMDSVVIHPRKKKKATRNETKETPPTWRQQKHYKAGQCMGTYLSCFNISWKQWRCMVWPHRSTDVSLSESNMYCLATTAKMSQTMSTTALQIEECSLQQQAERQKKQGTGTGTGTGTASTPRSRWGSCSSSSSRCSSACRAGSSSSRILRVTTVS